MDVRITGVVRCDQPRVLDLAIRHARKVDTLPAPNHGRGAGKGLHTLRVSRKRGMAAGITSYTGLDAVETD